MADAIEEHTTQRRAARDYAIPYLLSVVYIAVQHDTTIAWALALVSLGTSYLTGLFRSKEEMLGPDDLQLGLGTICFYISFVSGFCAGWALLLGRTSGGVP